MRKAAAGPANHYAASHLHAQTPFTSLERLKLSRIAYQLPGMLIYVVKICFDHNQELAVPLELFANVIHHGGGIRTELC